MGKLLRGEASQCSCDLSNAVDDKCLIFGKKIESFRLMPRAGRRARLSDVL